MLATSSVVDDEVQPFDQRSVELVTALAAQAAVAIENTLYADIERLFEGFVTAAVTAIEARDPTTYGHSGRVAAMSVALAEALDGGAGCGVYRSTHFSRAQLRELRYAGLLHDFGKVGVREQVLLKQKKLYPLHLDVIRLRFATLMQATTRNTSAGAPNTCFALVRKDMPAGCTSWRPRDASHSSSWSVRFSRSWRPTSPLCCRTVSSPSSRDSPARPIATWTVKRGRSSVRRGPIVDDPAGQSG